MIGVTAFGIFFTPMFYVLLRALAGNRPLTQHGEGTVDQNAPLAPGAKPPTQTIIIQQPRQEGKTVDEPLVFENPWD